MNHWAVKYVGYSYHQYNCAQLVNLVLKNEWGYIFDFGEIPKRLDKQSSAIKSRKDDFLSPVDKPREGDCVMMHSRNQYAHIGVYAEINGEGFVLHSINTIGSTCLHKIKDLKRYGLNIEGFYEWRK